jgi:CubicO group peptidase (beta-lactamase class C family)
MARWAAANLNRGELDGRRILKATSYDAIWKPASQRNPQTSVGLSWFLTEIHKERAVFHNGGDDGFRTRLVLFPDRQLAVFYMINCDYADLAAIEEPAIRIALGIR